jgi:hypothetical protein
VLKIDVAVLKTDTAYIKRDLGELRTGVDGVRVNQERDFRVLFGALISVALCLAGLMAKGFGWFH